MTFPSAQRRRPSRRLGNSGSSGRAIFATAALFVGVLPSRSGTPDLEIIPLPALQVRGQSANAHTQGLERVDGNYLVTARQEDVQPKRALLLRTRDGRSDWDCWDITPVSRPREAAILDHPGGIQSDGVWLWIPIAESRRHGRSRIRAYALESLLAGRPLTPAFEFEVADHIGALAVSRKDGLLFGANWDTEKVYLWDLRGHLKRVLKGGEVTARGLGVTTHERPGGGIAVQDWKMVGEDLFASGLLRSPGSLPASPASRLCRFGGFLDHDSRRQMVTLPRLEGVEPAREAMSISDGMVYFLPEDLGATNRLFRVPLTRLTEQDETKSLRPPYPAQ